MIESSMPPASDRRAFAGATVLAAAALLLGAAAFAAAALLPAEALACDHGLPEVGYLGIGDLSCDCSTNFAMKSRDGQAQLTRVWRFRSEPVVRNILDDGPSKGKLREGDVITAIDGLLITTREGSARFSSLEPGQTVRFTVRRDGREMPVVVNVGKICPEELGGVFSLGELVAPRAPETPEPRVMVLPTPDAAPAPAAPEAPETPPAPPRMPTPRAWRWSFRTPRSAEVPMFRPEALPQGWLGIGLTCQDCGGEVSDGARTPVWTFGTIPTVSYVDPEGPSARAGLHRGDQLTHIDGVSLVTPEGGKRFGAVKPGQVVRWRVIRDGSPRVIAVRAVDRPGEDTPDYDALRQQLRSMGDKRQLQSREMRDLMRKLGDLERTPPEMTPSASKRLRYAGSVGGSDVEVRGLGNVVVDDSGDEVVIITRDATIRIKPGGKVEKTPRRDR